ncbi:MAG TPA: sigma-70 factor domain-containing protein, partial [Rhodoglobus sp.]|nr:sigma-70 factor domain-containing protein [Rhodoglobus sp.]
MATRTKAPAAAASVKAPAAKAAPTKASAAKASTAVDAPELTRAEKAAATKAAKAAGASAAPVKAPATKRGSKATAPADPEDGNDDVDEVVEIDVDDDAIDPEEIDVVVAVVEVEVDVDADSDDAKDDDDDDDEKSTGKDEELPTGALVLSLVDDEDEVPVYSSAITGATADPVKDYLKQIGKVALLNAAEEVELAMRIEAGLFAEDKLSHMSAAEQKSQLGRELLWVAKDGQRAKSHLLGANLRLVVSL